MTSKQKWLDERVAELKLNKRQTRSQKDLIRLAEISKPLKQEANALVMLIKAEQAQDEHVKLKSAANNLLKASESRIRQHARSERSHELIKAAGLMSLAGLVDKVTGTPLMDQAVLVGALQSLARVTPKDKRWNDWKARGEVLLADGKPKRKASKVAAAQSTPDLADNAQKSQVDVATPVDTQRGESAGELTQQELRRQGLQ